MREDSEKSKGYGQRESEGTHAYCRACDIAHRCCLYKEGAYNGTGAGEAHRAKVKAMKRSRACRWWLRRGSRRYCSTWRELDVECAEETDCKHHQKQEECEVEYSVGGQIVEFGGSEDEGDGGPSTR